MSFDTYERRYGLENDYDGLWDAFVYRLSGVMENWGRLLLSRTVKHKLAIPISISAPRGVCFGNVPR